MITNLINSFKNNIDGFSGKKLTAFAVTCAYLYSHRFVDATNLVMALTVDAGLICGLFGINVVDKLKNGKE